MLVVAVPFFKEVELGEGVAVPGTISVESDEVVSTGAGVDVVVGAVAGGVVTSADGVGAGAAVVAGAGAARAEEQAAWAAVKTAASFVSRCYDVTGEFREHTECLISTTGREDARCCG